MLCAVSSLLYVFLYAISLSHCCTSCPWFSSSHTIANYITKSYIFSGWRWNTFSWISHKSYFSFSPQSPIICFTIYFFLWMAELRIWGRTTCKNILFNCRADPFHTCRFIPCLTPKRRRFLASSLASDFPPSLNSFSTHYTPCSFLGTPPYYRNRRRTHEEKVKVEEIRWVLDVRVLPESPQSPRNVLYHPTTYEDSKVTDLGEST